MDKHHIISLGAGVQSSTMLLMAIHGEITPKPELAIFADTREPKNVYAWLDYLQPLAEASGITVKRVKRGDIYRDVMSATKDGHLDNPPFHVRDEHGEMQMIRRKCTGYYKKAIIRKTVNQWVGGDVRNEKVVQWFGISWDEIERMHTSDVKYIEHRYPLVELQMTRFDCLKWMSSHGYSQPPKSSCTFCPFHSDHHWLQLYENDPTSFAEAEMVDGHIRNNVPGLRGQAYLHKSGQPLRMAIEAVKRAKDAQYTLFNMGDFQECGGYCGV